MRARPSALVLKPRALLLLLGALPIAATSRPATADEGRDLYRDGHYTEAIAWWREAAGAGAADAAYRLGVVYADGAVAETNGAEAARWFELAAQRGHARARFDLATLYDNGDGVEQSTAKALKWYRLAAEQGHMGAQYNLGSMYEQGHGVERDLVAAYTWYLLAAERGFPVARLGALERVESELTETEVEKATLAAHEFRAVP